MATRRARRPYRWLRHGVLLVLVLVVGAVVGLYWFGRQQRQPPPRRSEPLEAGTSEAQGIATVGQGFEYTHYVAGRKRFTLRALRTLEDREETLFLEGVDMLVYEEQGRSYELSANHARYNRERKEALLEGDVRLSSGDEITLSTEGLQLSQEGRLLTSTESAEIVYGDAYRAVGNRFRVHLPEDLFLLTGDVRVEEIPGHAAPFSLRAEKLQLEGRRQMLRAEGGVELERPDSRMTAQSVNAFLTEDLTGLRFLRARWEVEGYFLLPGRLGEGEVGPPPVRRVEFAGRSLSTLIRPDGEAPESSQLEGTPIEPAVIRTEDGSGVTRVITAGYLSSDYQPDGGQRVDAFGKPEIVEEVALAPGAEAGAGTSQLSGPPAPVRRLRGGRGWAEILPDGSVGRAQMMDGVEYRDGELRIRGEQTSFDLATGSGEFFGAESEEAPEEPAGPPPPDVTPRQRVARVTVVHPRGELVAPTVGYTREDGVVHARGGVSTVLRESLPLPGGVRLDGDGTVNGVGAAAAGTTTGGTAGEPTRLESAEAFFRDRPRSALFRGDVRAWQGNSVLLAQWLRANDETQELTAGGGVRTVAAQSPTPERPEPAPMTVTAEELSYAARGVAEPGADGGTEVGTANGNPGLIYRHQVRVEDGQRRVACERLEVFLDEDGRAERLVALEKVVLQDPQTGKEARAQRAVWRPEDRPGGGKVALFGAPAVVRDGRGAEVKAPELTYDLITGRVRAGTPPGPEASTAGSAESPVAPAKEGTGRER